MVRVLLSADDDDIADLEVSAFGGLPVFPKFCLVGQLDHDRAAILVRQIKRIRMYRRNLSEKWGRTIVLRSTAGILSRPGRNKS
jgi:hypothetical protein